MWRNHNYKIFGALILNIIYRQKIKYTYPTAFHMYDFYQNQKPCRKLQVIKMWLLLIWYFYISDKQNNYQQIWKTTLIYQQHF